MQIKPVKMVFGFGILLLIAVFMFRQLHSAKEASLPVTPRTILQEFKERLMELIDSSEEDF